MSAPAGTKAELSIYLEQLEARIGILEGAQSPRPVYACTSANLPSPVIYMNCVVRVTDLDILAASNGVDWIRQDSGAPV